MDLEVVWQREGSENGRYSRIGCDFFCVIFGKVLVCYLRVYVKGNFSFYFVVVFLVKFVVN